MYKFGSIQSPSGGARPNGLQVSFITGKCLFFLGDHWENIGAARIGVTRSGKYVPVLPDFDAYFAERSLVDDGAKEWHEWGPRVN